MTVRARTPWRVKLEHMVVEARMRRYAHNPADFFAECVSVEDPTALSGRTPFVLFDYQREDLELLQNERYVMILKARQLGLTTLVMAWALHQLLFKKGSNIILVSKDQDTANTALDLLEFMLTFLPDWVKPALPVREKNNATEKVFRFSDGMKSRIVSRPATRTVGAGEVATLVIWDEAALAEMQEDTMRSLQPTTDRGGSMVIFSTARGGFNLFARQFRAAVKGHTEFKTVFHPWWVSRLINPLAGQIATCDTVPCVKCVDETRYHALRQQFKDKPWLFYSERPTSVEEAFSSSGRVRFPDLPAQHLFHDLPNRGRLVGSGEDWSFVHDEGGNLWLSDDAMEGPPHGVWPVVAVDPAAGGGGDYTAAVGGWLDERGVPRITAVWHANDVETVEAAREIADLGNFFNNGATPALLVVEQVGGWGWTFLNEWTSDRVNYPNLYVSKKIGKVRGQRQESTMGFPMTATRRPLVIDKLAEWLPSEHEPHKLYIGNIPRALRDELGAFVVTESGKVAADQGMHDDLVMAAAIWCYVLVEENVVPSPAAGATERAIGEKDVLYIKAFDLAAELRAATNKEAARADRKRIKAQQRSAIRGSR